MAATTGSTGTSSLAGGWLTAAQSDAVTGYPDTPEYPGPVTGDHADPGPADPGRSGPPQGAAPPAIPAAGGVPAPDTSGGVITDQVAELGHSAPMGPAFSQDRPFAPPGAIAPVHGYDTGGVERTERVPMPRSPGWFRRVLTGQTFNRQSFTTTTEGWQVNSANDRVNLNQDQGQDADAYDPFWLPYSERPLKANFAAEAYPVDPISTAYGVDGQLADMAGLGGQGNFGYTSPPDPAVNVQPAQAPAEQPAVGMEYVYG